jgi:hypothetical protein
MRPVRGLVLPLHVSYQIKFRKHTESYVFEKSSLGAYKLCSIWARTLLLYTVYVKKRKL